MTESSAILEPVDVPILSQWSQPSLFKIGKVNVLWTAEKHGKRYVLKGLREEFQTSTVHLELLRKEFHIAANLDHPAIVRTLDYGTMPKVGEYIQMEYVDGRTMIEWLQEKPGYEARKRVLIQLLESIEYLHLKQILHRDLKTTNILITRNGDNVRLIDFGIADADDYVILKQAGGTRGYIAPEVLENKDVDCRSDIFALGKIMRLLFPHRYRWVAAGCCRRDRTERYPNVGAVLRAIHTVDRLLRLIPVLLLTFCLVCCVLRMMAQQDGLRDMEKNLAVYQQEKQLIESAIQKSDSIFTSNVLLPYRQGEIIYVQDFTQAVEAGRKDLDEYIESIEDEYQRAKVHNAAYDVWVRNYNQFIEVYQPNQLPAKRQ